MAPAQPLPASETSRASQPRRCSGHRWHHVYFLLAAFNMATVLFGLWLSQKLASTYSASVDVNQEWAERQLSIGELRELAAAVSAPGTDVFQSQNVLAEAKRLRDGLREYRVASTELRRDLAQLAAPGFADAAFESLFDLDDLIQKMAADAGEAIALATDHRTVEAGAILAGMDRRLGKANKIVDAIEDWAAAAQRIYFRAQEDFVTRLQRLQILSAALVIAMVAGSTVYGVLFSRRMRDSISEIERARDDAELAARTKSEFLANMSHEIRTPMNGIMGLTELVLQTPLSNDQKQHLELVQSSADSLMTVLNDILDFSKIEAGKMQLDPEDFSVREAVGNALKLFGLRASQKKIELVCRVEREVPDYVIGDAGRLRQILVNLLGNAIKFTNHGEIVVNVGVTSTTDAATTLSFSVRDTGIGIAEDKLGTVFEAFTQADGSMTRRFGGTGLGLTICRRLVQLMGGDIHLDSTLGKGSTFSFEATFGASTVTSDDQQLAPLVSLEGLRVLIVDDNATNRLILREMLDNWSMTPTVVDDGSQAIAELDRGIRNGRPYELVLLDAHMPETDGFTVARQMRARAEFSDTRVMMLTSVDQSNSAGLCQELGLASYLTKPIKQSELLDAILVAQQSVRRSGPYAAPLTQRPDVATHLSPLDVLVAEDNFVNQQLVRQVLEREGHKVTFANNGREAVEITATRLFDVVLMDVQMPLVDGYEATIAIRNREAGEGKPPLPIIALTAHAMQGDCERCLGAGMDAYVAKPIQVNALFSTIARLLECRKNGTPFEPRRNGFDGPRQTPPKAGARAPAADAAPSSPEPAPLSLDREALLTRLGGDMDAVKMLSEIFCEESPRQLDEIRTALSAHDGPQLKKAAHSFKGTAANLGGVGAATIAKQIELDAEAADFTAASGTFSRLEREMETLIAELRALTADEEASV